MSCPLLCPLLLPGGAGGASARRLRQAGCQYRVWRRKADLRGSAPHRASCRERLRGVGRSGASAGFLAGICGGGRDVAVAPAGVITYFASWPGVVSPVNSAQLAASFRDASPQDRPNPMSIRIGTESAIALQPSRATISACSKFFTEKDRLSCICNSGTMPVW